MTLTSAQLRFVRDNTVFNIVETAISQGISQTDIDFALRVKSAQLLEAQVNTG